MDKKEFDNFFKSYSKNVDNANKHGFWKLSDTIIMQIIKDNIPIDIDKENIILDAGGGTGRWVCELSKSYDCNFILYDLSEDMLKQAKKNIKECEVENKVKIVKGDLIDMSELKDESVDYIISLYNPISFVYKKERAFKELFRSWEERPFDSSRSRFGGAYR